MLAEIEWRGVEPGPARASAPNELMQLGEGQPLYLARIPNISLVTVPQYLLSSNDQPEQCDPRRHYRPPRKGRDVEHQI
jgi:hypothetical protein